MEKLIRLAGANIRKSMGQAVSLFVFILIAAALLNVGLLMLLSFGTSFDKRAEELHTPHYAIMEPETTYTEEQLAWFVNHPDTTETEKETIYSFATDVTYNEGEMIMFLNFLDAEAPRSMNDLSLMDGSAPRAADEVCLPYLFKVGGGYKLGDRFSFTYKEHTLDYRISGFSEDMLFGTNTIQLFRIFLSAEGFANLAQELPQTRSVFLTTRTVDPATSERLHQDFIQEFFYREAIPEAEALLINSIDIISAKRACTFISSITSAILVVFAGVIVLVSLIVIHFRIQNSIVEDMENIGALKAAGYTSAQVIASFALQFGLISAVAALVGVASSYALLPVVSSVLEQQSAFVWEQGFDAGISGLTWLAILVVVLLVTLIATRRISRLQPLEALRGGLTTHSFRRNHLPLERSAAPLPLSLALKTALHSKGQMAMITLVVAALAFASTVGLSVYYNLGVDSWAFAQLIGGEVPDAAFRATSPEDASRLRREFSTDEAVRKTFHYQDLTVMAGDDISLCIVVEDYALLEAKSILYEGRYPLHNNEIALGATLSEHLGKGIGDSIEVVQGGNRAEYLVCGLIQTVNNMGIACAVTDEGMRRIQSDFAFRQLYVYLDDPSTAKDFIERVTAANPTTFEYTVNLQDLMQAQLTVYGVIFAVIAAAILTVTVLVVALVLYLVLRTAILRHRRALGVQKALGFSTLQLMNQISLSYLPAVTLGVALGVAAGALGFNSVFVALVRTLGIMTASMPAPLLPTIIMGVVLVLIAYAISLLIALAIRRIDPYRLIVE